MKHYRYDILIIGGGIFGAAIFYQANKQTHKRIALLEKQRFCSGATASSGGFIRVLHNSIHTTELALRSLEEFQNFEAITGYTCDYNKTGFFMLENQDDSLNIEKKIKLFTQQNYTMEFISAIEARKNFANVNLPATEEKLIIYEPAAGYADPVKATLAYLNAGMQLGGFACENSEVIEILTKNGKVTGVKTAYAIFEAPCVVITAGKASITLLTNLGITTPGLAAKNIQISFYNYLAATPPVATFFDKVSGLYGRHYSSQQCLFGTTKLSDANAINEAQIDYSLSQHTDAVAKANFPWLKNVAWQGGRCAADAYTENHEGIAEFLPAPTGLFLCTGWSGVGFKLAPECAKRVIKQLVQFC